jgi:hypothetical protein
MISKALMNMTQWSMRNRPVRWQADPHRSGTLRGEERKRRGRKGPRLPGDVPSARRLDYPGLSGVRGS